MNNSLIEREVYIRITKQFNFEMAHALEGHDGPCKNIHGHSYRLSVTLKGVPCNDKNDPKCGMIMDFKDLGNVVRKVFISDFDHSLVLKKNTALSKQVKQKEVFGKTILVDFQPTCENLLIYIAKKIKNELPNGISLCKLMLRETPDSFAEWEAQDN